MQLNYKQFGQGEPLIILHGLFGMLDNWQTLARKFAEDYTVFIIDQRNHGKSPHHPDFNYSLMAEDLREFMEQNWIYEANLIGHSMGGKTVMQFAMEYPDMVNKMVVVDIAPKSYVGGHQTIFEALLSLDLDHITNRKDAEEQLALHIKQQGVRQFLLKNLSRKKEGGYAYKMNLSAIHKHYQNILDNVNGEKADEVEALFIRGGNSNYINENDLALIHESFPRATLKTIHEAGHWVHAEKPLELLEMVRMFLKED